jgi:Icc-related predicted phosphoesterase
MKIVCISDTHGKHSQVEVPDGDILIHAGDFCNWGTSSEVKDFNKWLGTLNFKKIICTAGNHDICLDKNCNDPRTGNKKYDGHKLLTNAIYLENESVEIDGIKFFGSPYSNIFLNWAFMEDESYLATIWEKIPDDTNVLITHGPAYGILDEVPRAGREYGDSVGSKSLSKRVEELKKLKYHLFGHIHDCYGQKVFNGITHINASVCTEAYEPINEPIVIDI